MTDRIRIAITVAIALMFGAVTYGENAFDLDLGAAEWTLGGLVVFGVFLVYRWWALLPALVPAAVLACLYVFTDYSPHEGDPGGALFDESVWLLLVMGVVTVIEVAFLAVGLLLRWIWERVRARRELRAT